MKVKELIEQLKTLPQEAELIMSKDAEGNNFEGIDDVCLYESHFVIFPNDVPVEIE